MRRHNDRSFVGERVIMAHYVSFTVPDRDLGNADIVFRAWDDEEKIGTLRVSKGAIEWFAKDSKRPTRKMTWRQFSKRIMRD